MKNVLLGLFVIGTSLSAMEQARFSIMDPQSILPDNKYCLICQKNDPSLGKIEQPTTIMLADWQRFNFKSHLKCHEEVVFPLIKVIERNYPAGKIQQAIVQKFLWNLYVDASAVGSSMKTAFSNQKFLLDVFNAYLTEVLSRQRSF